MFYHAGKLSTTWNIGTLSNWNTSKVTDMQSMFNLAGFSANSLILDLSNWNTSKVTNMRFMFNMCENDIFSSSTTWSVGDLSNWDTSKVTDMNCMFQGAGYNATTWNIGNLNRWDTSQVTDMGWMFNKAGYKATTFNIGNLTNWDTRNVTNMNAMFCKAGANATTWNSIGTLDVRSSDLIDFFYGVPKAKATLNIYVNPTVYSGAFTNTATDSNAEIIINYKSSVTNIDNLIATKSSNSHVYKSLEILD